MSYVGNSLCISNADLEYKNNVSAEFIFVYVEVVHQELTKE